MLDTLLVQHRPAGKRMLERRAWPMLVLLAAWLILVLPRAAWFGFYHDDWSSVVLPPGRSASLGLLLADDPGRPLYVLTLHVLRPLLGHDVVLWQILLAVIQLLNAWAMASIAASLSARTNRDDGRWLGAMAGSLWLVVPWSLGYSAWSVMLPPDIGMLLALVAIARLVRPGANTSDVNSAVGLLFLSWLIYEATWMIWLPFALVLWLRAGDRADARRLALRFLFSGGALQALFVLWNRLISAHAVAGKKLSSDILAVLQTDHYLLGHQLLDSLVWHRVFVLALALLLAAALLNIPRWMREPHRYLLPVCMLLGVALSAVIYAAAGYAIEWTGLFSRSTLPISVWLVLCFVGVFSLGWSGGARLTRALLVASLIGTVVPLAGTLWGQSLQWKASWDEQQRILSALPRSVVDLAGPHSLILADVPRGPAPVFTFDAFWDISGAITLRMPLARAQAARGHMVATVLRPGEWRTTWDGTRVTQYWCSAPDSPLWSLPARRVYLWRYPQQQAGALTAPYDSGCPRR